VTLTRTLALVVALIVAVIVGRDGPSVSVGVGIFALTNAALALVAQPARQTGVGPNRGIDERPPFSATLTVGQYQYPTPLQRCLG
jgi:hypothetical protein